MTLIRQGSRGIEVSALQFHLNEMILAAAPLEIDGIFGSLTLNAVLAFQMNAQLSADGIVGPKTWGVIASRFGEENDQPAPNLPLPFRESSAPRRIFIPPQHHAAEARLAAEAARSPAPSQTQAFPSRASFVPASHSGPGSSSPSAPSQASKEQSSIVDPFGRLGKNAEGDDIVGVIYFKTNEVTLDGQDIIELRKLQAYEKVLGSKSIVFECQGVADPRGTKEGNRIIARQRAEAVAKKIPTLLAPNVRANAKTSVIALGPAFGPAINNPFQRVCFIIAPPLQRGGGGKKKKPPNLTARVLRAHAVIHADRRSDVEANHLLCMLKKIQDGHNLGKNLRDLNDKNFGFYTKTNTTPDFRNSMQRGLNRGPVTSAEDANWWAFIADMLESSAFDHRKKTFKQMRDTLRGMDLELQKTVEIVFNEVASAGGSSSSRTPNEALNQIHDLMQAKFKNQRSVYSCWKDILKP